MSTLVIDTATDRTSLGIFKDGVEVFTLFMMVQWPTVKRSRS